MLIAKRIAKIIVIAIILFVILIIFLIRGSYRTNQILHSEIQKNDNVVGRLLNIVVSSPLRFIFQQHLRYLEGRDWDSLSPVVFASYTQDDRIGGYGDEIYSKGGDQISQQQRGLILPTLRKKLEQLGPNVVAVEIGTGNGDVAALVATEYPEIRVIGIDFSVAMATQKHSGIANLSFQKGYALEILESRTLRGDILWASGTVSDFTPRELHRYLAIISKIFCHIIISEPIWGRHVVQMNGPPFSEHLEDATWFHDYLLYAKHYGYSIDYVEHEPYKHPISTRSDVQQLIASGSK